jgi:hypothetical protein
MEKAKRVKIARFIVSCTKRQTMVPRVVKRVTLNFKSVTKREVNELILDMKRDGILYSPSAGKLKFVS